MKYYIFHMFFLTLFSFGTVQGQVIDSIKFSPSEPQPGDTITFYCHVTYPSVGCTLEESSIYSHGTSIVGRAFHCGGFSTQLCPAIDSFKIATHSTYIGTYTFFYMPGFIISSPCVFPIFGNGDTIPYPYAVDYVEVPVGISSNTYKLSRELSENVKLYPLPADKQVIIEFTEIIKVDFFMDLLNINGQKISLIYNQLDSKRVLINTQDYFSGIYFLKIRNGNNITTKKIVIHH